MATNGKRLSDEWEAIFIGPGDFEGTEKFAGHISTSPPSADAYYHRFSKWDQKFLAAGRTLYARRLSVECAVVFTPDEGA